MGEDARWVCSTCKTICYRGGTPIFKGIPGDLTVKDVNFMKSSFSNLMQTIRLVGDDENRYISFLDDLKVWLSVHEGHNIHIGSDMSTDMWDFEDYRVEEVDGTAHTLTIIEEVVEAQNKAVAKAISEISELIKEYASGKGSMSLRTVAKVILRKCSVVC